jgi:hypothetical protein
VTLQFYDPDIAKELEDVFTAGASIRLACDYVGITVEMYTQWLSNPEFDRRMRKARATLALRNLAHMNKQAPKDWRAAKSALEFAFPDELKGSEPEPDPTPWRQTELRIEESG